MGWGFATWDANGVDNNTGLVKINSLGVFQADSNTAGTYNFTLPSGYTLAFLVQPAGVFSGRRRITVSGGSITLANVADNDYSAGTYPRYSQSFILVYAR